MGKTLGVKRLLASKTQKKYAVVPRWVIVMYNSIFFRSCVAHESRKKSELDRFCIDCLHSFCSHCLPSHAGHNHVKIRRYIYSDVINRQDLCKLFNCSGIQTYQTNKAKVLFLKQRHHPYQQQQNHSRDYSCTVCDKRLQDNSSLYCSIACKVLAIHGDHEHKEKIVDDHNYTNKNVRDDHYEEYLNLLSPKRLKLKHSRKGLPLRAPMF